MCLKRIAACILLLLIVTITEGQDPHFSQYFASPLTVNPANTGFFDGSVRVNLNERQQWFNVGSAYTTTSISADLKILANKIPEYDVLAVGVSGLFDGSLGGALQSNYVSTSVAYHKALAYQGSQMLSVGAQITYANIALNFNDLTFASQFNGVNFDTSIPVYTGVDNSTNNYLDVQGGILYTMRSPDFNFYTGVSVYHIAKPRESLLNSSDYRLPYRSTIHAGGDVVISDRSSILFSGIFMAQGAAREQMLGAAYGLGQDDSNLKLYLGMWVRFNDAVIPYLGFDYKNFSVGANYTSTYNGAFTYRPATIELSLTYRSKIGLGPHCFKF